MLSCLLEKPVKLRELMLAALLLPLPVLAAELSPLPQAAPEQVGISAERLQLLDTLLRQHIDEGHVAGLVAGVARKGQLVYLQAMGWQDIENGLPMREDSIFQIRSMSKAVTSMAVMQLVEQGRLGMQDPVSRYIPSFADVQVMVNPADPENTALRAPSRAITIEDLLLNIGGLSHRDSALYQSAGVRSRAETLDVMVDKIAATPLVSDPGTQWVYSESASVLGRVIELVTGEKLDAYLANHVSGPLGMPDTAFYVPADKQNRLAQIYRAPRDGQGLTRVADMEVPITADPPLLEGAIGLVSTVPDYMRFLQTFLNGGTLDGQRVLGEALSTKMRQNNVPPALMPIGMSPRNPWGDLGWGYGFTVVVDETHSAYGVNNGEFGWNGTLGTFSWADPETETVAVLMLQVQPAGAYRISALFKALVAQSIVAP